MAHCAGVELALRGTDITICVTVAFLPRRYALREQGLCVVPQSGLAPERCYISGKLAGKGEVPSVLGGLLSMLTGLWSVPSPLPPGLHGHWLPIAERALHTAPTRQPLPPQGPLAPMSSSCLWAEMLPPTRITGPWVESEGSAWGGGDPSAVGPRLRARHPLSQKH